MSDGRRWQRRAAGGEERHDGERHGMGDTASVQSSPSRSRGGTPTTCGIQYTKISVTIAPFKMPKPKRPLITATYNLSEVLTDLAYIGFSAAT
jgi:hypothetical protein